MRCNYGVIEDREEPLEKPFAVDSFMIGLHKWTVREAVMGTTQMPCEMGMNYNSSTLHMSLGQFLQKAGHTFCLIPIVVHDGPAKCEQLTHWGQVTPICIGKITIIGSDNGLLPERRQPII